MHKISLKGHKFKKNDGNLNIDQKLLKHSKKSEKNEHSKIGYPPPPHSEKKNW